MTDEIIKSSETFNLTENSLESTTIHAQMTNIADNEEANMLKLSHICDSVRCVCCYDVFTLPTDLENTAPLIPAYVCSNSACCCSLCFNCLWQHLEITIGSALYAVPRLKCPGVCGETIPMATWRGSLRAAESNTMNTSMWINLLKIVVSNHENGGFGKVEKARGWDQDSLCQMIWVVESLAASLHITKNELYTSGYSQGLLTPQSADLPSIDLVCNSFEQFSAHWSSENASRHEKESLSGYCDAVIIPYVESDSDSIAAYLCVFMSLLLSRVERLDLRNTLCNALSSYQPPPVQSILEERILSKYEANAKALMTLRCGSCDITNTLFISNQLVNSCNNRLAAVNSIVTTLFGEDFSTNLSIAKRVLDFLMSWSQFLRGKCSTSFFADQLLEVLDIKSYTESSVNRGMLPMAGWDVLDEILKTTSDVERRFALQFEMLRRFPKITMELCCGYPHCFRCKVSGHHELLSCEEYQAAEMGTECQYCPGCNVPTIRSEGCSDIICVCGMNWEWRDVGGGGRGGRGRGRGGRGQGGRGEGRGRGTLPCRRFARGECRYGDRCWFRHTPLDSEGREPCISFSTLGHCRFGNHCRFWHADSFYVASQTALLTAQSAEAARPMCRLGSRCRFRLCRYRHPVNENVLPLNDRTQFPDL